MQPIPPIVTAVQPIPPPVALPPTISDEPHLHVPPEEPPFDADGDRRARRRAVLARVLGVLGILATAAFAFVTVGRAWLRSLPTVVWPASLVSPESPVLPEPLRPNDEPVMPTTPIEPPIAPPAEAAPSEAAPVVPSAPVESTAAPGAPPAEQALPPAARRVERERPAAEPAVRRRSNPVVPPPAAAPTDEATPDERMEPEDLPAPPPVDPAAPESPPAGEAPPRIPADEGNTVFGED